MVRRQPRSTRTDTLSPYTTLFRSRDALAGARSGRVLLLSSVPALGPRLSWVEAVMSVTPRMEKYEDDLRDQWQSHAHREEWRRFLRLLIETHTRDTTPVTVLSGRSAERRVGKACVGTCRSRW